MSAAKTPVRRGAATPVARAKTPSGGTDAATAAFLAPLPPRPLSSKEFATELGRLCAILDDKQNWERRYEALRHIRAILDADVSKHEDCIAVLGNTLKMALRGQLQDLRSAICREACACVQSLANHSRANGQLVESSSDWYVALLLQNACATVSAISVVAEDTLKLLAGLGRLNRHAILAYFLGCSSKHGTVRRVSFECVWLMLQAVDAQVVARCGSQVEGVIRTGLQDALPEIRRASRRAFWAYEATCEKEAALLFRGLDATLQASVMAEKSASGSQVPPIPADTAALSDGAGKGGGDPTLAGGGAAHGPAPSPAASASSWPARPDASASAVRRPPHAPTPLPAAAGYAAAASSAHRATPTGRRTPSAEPPSGPLLPPGHRQYQKSQVPRSGLTLPRPVMFRMSTNAARGRYGGPEDDEAALITEEAWSSIIVNCASADWMARLAGFSAIGQLASQSLLKSAKGTDAVNLIVKHVNDTHHRVACAAVTALLPLLEGGQMAYGAGLMTAPMIDKIIMAVVSRLSDSKEQLRDLSNIALDTAVRELSPEVIMQSLVRQCDQLTGRTRIAALDVLAQLIIAAPAAFHSAPVLRQTVTRLVNLANHNMGNDVQKATVPCLVRIYEANREAFVSYVISLQPNEQLQAITLLQKPIPHLHQDCRRMLAGEALVDHAPPTLQQDKGRFAGMVNASGGSPMATAASLRPPPISQRTIHADPLGHAGGGGHVVMASSPSPTRWGPGPKGGGNSPVSPTSTSSPPQGSRSSYGAGAASFATTGRPIVGPSGKSASALVSEWRRDRAVPPQLSAMQTAVTSSEKLAALAALLTALPPENDSTDGGRNHKAPLAVISKEEAVWIDHFNTIATQLVALTADADHAVRWKALAALRLVACRRGPEVILDQAATLHDHALRASVACLDDSFPEVQREALSSVSAIVERFGARATLPLMIAIAEALRRVSAKTLSYVLREVGRLASVIAPEDTSMVPEVVQLLTACFTHENAEIRKTVVLCFVDLYVALGDALLPHVTHLAVSQLKLISIYIGRVSGGNSADGSGGGVAFDLHREMLNRGLLPPPGVVLAGQTMARPATGGLSVASPPDAFAVASPLSRLSMTLNGTVVIPRPSSSLSGIGTATSASPSNSYRGGTTGIGGYVRK